MNRKNKRLCSDVTENCEDFFSLSNKRHFYEKEKNVMATD